VTSNGSSNERTAAFSQAVGMISVQADCTMEEAETKLRDRAALNGELVEELARAVVERRVRFIT
jgi:hypothetical protein